MPILTDRLRHLRHLIQQNPFASIMGAIALLFTWFSIWKQEFATQKEQDALRMVNFIPHLSLGWWVAVTVGIICLWLFEASFQRQRPGMRLEYDKDGSRALLWDVGQPSVGPLRMGFLVRLKNNTDKKLEDCRIRIKIRTLRNQVRPKEISYTVCKPFSLVPDDDLPIPIFEFNFDDKDPEIRIPLVGRKGEVWSNAETWLVLRPEAHDLTVEALSAHSRIDRMMLRLRYRNEQWIVNGQPTSKR